MNPVTPPEAQPSFVERVVESVGRRWQQILDRSTPHTNARWAVFFSALALYALRVYLLEGFYIVTYALAIFLLNLFIGFLSPLDEDLGTELPVSVNDKPFMRRLPEFKFWFVVCRFAARPPAVDLLRAGKGSMKGP
jgi:hypothetical protein